VLLTSFLHAEQLQVKDATKRLALNGFSEVTDTEVLYALRASSGDVPKAVELVTIIEESFAGVIYEYNTETKLVGAQNREQVTCYLDALIFAMFSQLDSFEALLKESFEDYPRRMLTILLRLWVNLLRRGKLITVDLVR
jgi:hypothetical protein